MIFKYMIMEYKNPLFGYHYCERAQENEVDIKIGHSQCCGLYSALLSVCRFPLS